MGSSLWSVFIRGLLAVTASAVTQLLIHRFAKSRDESKLLRENGEAGYREGRGRCPHASVRVG